MRVMYWAMAAMWLTVGIVGVVEHGVFVPITWGFGKSIFNVAFGGAMVGFATMKARAR
jgi:hypothetical protein